MRGLRGLAARYGRSLRGYAQTFVCAGGYFVRILEGKLTE
ncbi:hypothetical protein HMPREF9056_00941 [Actinomyces sp. oral taxon 170 str. F0386]|nr:hypothetical protein HMPREF9056_00941 [Actinomyces sp. oral taxon 170 str. F0386]